MDALQRHKTALIAVVLVAMSLLFMFLSGRVVPGHRGGVVADSINKIVGFVQSGVSELLDGVGNGLGKYTGLLTVEKDNRKLKAQLQEIKPFLANYRRLQRENARLRSLVGYTKRHPAMKTMVAHVVARSLNPYFRVIRLRVAAPSPKTIPQRAAVLSPKGVVGRIMHNFGSYADCLLLSDKRSRVPAYAPQKEVQGVVIGKGADTRHRAVFRVLASSRVLSDGIDVVTSGRDGTFPEGMEIGKIKAIKLRRQSGLYMDYPIELSSSVEDQQDLLIVVGSQGVTK